MNESLRNELETSLRWRYATKTFDPAKKISDLDWATLTNTLHLAPSSFGLQPWKFIVIDTPEVRQKIRAAAWNQSQVVDASKLIALAAKRTVTQQDVEKLIESISSQRNINLSALADYQAMISGFIAKPPFPLNIEEWTTRQVYLALGSLLTAAAMLKVDACPMEGFTPSAVDEILGLVGTEYSVKVLCPLGYRSDGDHHASLVKVRYPQEDIFEGR